MTTASDHTRVKQIDSARGIAALSVCLFHSLVFAGALSGTGLVDALVQPGEVGVVIFLLLSGYLLYRPFALAHIDGGDGPPLIPYAVRRTLRIVPAYWVALVLGALILSWGYVFGDGFLTYFGLAQVYREMPVDRSAIAPAWTLGLEISFYIFLPFWALLLRRFGTHSSPERRMRIQYIALAALFCSSVLYKIVMLTSGALPAGLIPPNMPLLSTLPAHLDEFAIGMALAVLSIQLAKGGTMPAPLGWVARRPLIALMAGLAAYAISVFIYWQIDSGVIGFSHLEFALRTIPYWVIATAVVLPAVLGATGIVGKVMTSRPLVWMGMISYGIYLWHWVVLVWINEHYHHFHSGARHYAEGILIPLPLIIAMATLSYVLVERPSIDLGRRFSRRYKDRERKATLTADELSAP